MFGDAPSDYCDHQAWRMKVADAEVQEGHKLRLICNCGMGFTVDIRPVVREDSIREQKKLEAAVSRFSTDLTKGGREFPRWLAAIGAGQKEIFVYTAHKKHPKLPSTWEEYPVVVKYIGKLKLQ